MSLDFSHFEIYFVHYSAKFKKSADPLVLFVHWSMIQNRFRCINESELHHTLPLNWLDNDSFYDFQYKKYDVIYRLEIYIANECALIQLKNMENLMDSSQYVKIDDFIDLDSFKSDLKFSKIYKDLHRLYTSIKWSIDRFRCKKNEKSQETSNKRAESAEMEVVESTIPSSVSSSQTQLSKKGRKESKKSFGLIFDILSNKLVKSNPEAVRDLNSKMYTSTYAEFLSHIKQEKAEFESNVEIYRRSSVSSSRSNDVISSSSSNNLVEFGNQKQKKANKKNRPSVRKANGGEENSQEADTLKPKINPDDKDNVERDKINRNLLFDYNPITNYYNYNNKADSKTIDQKLIEEDQFVKRAYEKFDLKTFCEVKLVDCFSSDLFKGLKVPIKLDDKMKQALDLDNEDDQYDDIEVVHKKKPRKVRKNIWREKKRVKSKKKKTEVKKKPEENDTANQDHSLLEKSSDLMNYFKNGTLKRKRTDSTASSVLPNLDDTDSGESNQVTRVEDKEEDSSYKSPVIEKQASLNDSVAKKLTFSATIQSSITVSRVEKSNDDTLSINLFADEYQPPSKRTRRDSNDKLVDLDASIEQDEIAVKQNLFNSPSKSTTKAKILTTPIRQMVAMPACTPNSVNSKLKEISNCALDSFEECLAPGKFYKNSTSTQKNDENCLLDQNSLGSCDEEKKSVNLDDDDEYVILMQNYNECELEIGNFHLNVYNKNK
ncbi:hypothetical protein BpHYR1_008100 [Brachionus plicatilis]|uniref:PI31 proteasome regulator N-terminal domain-containing protein n=1 Tax=Brachionus plicatilis TaxID=10195 RepID=A0A3M7QZH1_BRAPC|nr:hypothetical protein BpHYR1_008100 [Brachionus plicatilis]